MTKSDPWDLATRADRGIEAYLRRAIRRRFPDHAIGGEEFGARRSDKPWSWLIDPVDGTFNYVTDLPSAATTIALLYRDRPRVGAVADLTSGEILTAAATSHSIYRSRRRGHVERMHTRQDGGARLFLEYGAERLDDWMVAGLGALTARRDTVPRLVGSAAVALAAVATHGGCFVGVGLRAWDVSGGICLAEASGHVVRWWEDAYPGVHVLVGQPEVVSDLEPVVEELVTQWRVHDRASA